MKRIALACVVAALAIGAPLAPVVGLPGPDPSDAPKRFEIFVRELEDDHEVYESLSFSRSKGWDFGDRAAYACAWVEYVSKGNVQFRIDFELVVGPDYEPGSLEINDRDGVEEKPDGQTRCGDGDGPGANLQFDGSTFVPGGAGWDVHKRDQLLVTYRLPAVSNDNDESFWSVGDQKREAYLWYGEGGRDPVPVLRAFVRPVGAHVSVVADG
jgi:hypothetical protein